MTTIEENNIINAYKRGKSMTSIARDHCTYATTICRILEKHGIPLRHDIRGKGRLQVKYGEELIEWAKSQHRPVTKAELANYIGTKRLSPSYFIKYPELGQYVVTHEQKDLQEYADKLYAWLQKNNIQYKPNDRTKLKMSVTALLLGEYSKLALQINIKPSSMSKDRYNKVMKTKLHRASEMGMTILWLDKESFNDLDSLIPLMEAFKI